MAETHDFNVDQGTTWNRQLVWNDADDNPVDLTGFTARMQIRRDVQATGIDLSLTTENGGITIDSPAGKVTMYATAAQTALLAGTYYYDLEMVSGDDVTRLLQGKFILDREVTR